MRARTAGVNKIIVTGTSIEQSQAAAKLASTYPSILYSTAGIHPHDASGFTAANIYDLTTLAVLPQVKAIGECGLDFNRMFSTKDQQIKAFEAQLELAISLQMPLFLHERDAFQQQWQMLAHYRDQIPAAVIHCFTGSRIEAFRYLDLDLYIGITGWICDERRGQHLHEFVGDIPLNRLMIETDSPYLMPRLKPKLKLKSSRRNEPCTLPYVLAEIARHSASTIETIAAMTTQNARCFFNLDNS
jgi:TatD DNase family protein